MPIDYKRYPPNWKSEILPFIKKRSGNKCECCKLHNGQEVYSVKFKVKDQDGRYKYKNVWFSSYEDSKREQMFLGHPPKRVKVCLTVAHLDHDETNWEVSMDRLKHMCQVCHLRYDSKEKYRRINNF